MEAPNPNNAPPIGPAGPSAKPRIPEFVKVPIVIAPIAAPTPAIPATLPPDATPLLLPNLLNIPFTVFTKPSCPFSASPYKNFWNMSDLINMEEPIPSNAPAIGPPTNVPSNPPPVKVPLIAPRAAPPTRNFLFSLTKFCIFLLMIPFFISFPSSSVSPNKNFWNFSDFDNIPVPNPNSAPPIGPPIAQPNRPPDAKPIPPPTSPPVKADGNTSEAFFLKSSNVFFPDSSGSSFSSLDFPNNACFHPVIP